MATEKQKPTLPSYPAPDSAPATAPAAEATASIPPRMTPHVRACLGQYYVHPTTRVRIDSRGRPLTDDERTNWLKAMIERGMLEVFDVACGEKPAPREDL